MLLVGGLLAAPGEEGSLIATPSVSEPIAVRSESKIRPSLGILVVTGGVFVRSKGICSACISI
jgi:hypothetical protein